MNRPLCYSVFLSLFCSNAYADWSQSFDDGTVPESWEIRPHPVFNPDTGTISTDASLGYLTISEGRSFADGGTTLLRAVETNESFRNVRIGSQVNLDPSIGTFMGVTLDTLGPVGAYSFSAVFAEDDDVGTAWLVRSGAGGLTQWGSERDFGIPTKLDITESYYMELEILGNQLTGRVLDSENGVELIRMQQIVPNPLAEPGFAGVVTGTPVGEAFDFIPTGGTFDNISAVAIPEPTSWMLLLLGGLLFLGSNRLGGSATG